MIATIEALNYTMEDFRNMLGIMRTHGLHDWSLKIARSKKVLGQCRYNCRQIDISIYQPSGCYMDTLLHEIAHALTPYHGHDSVWAAKCIELGAIPQECASGQYESDYMYVYGCSHCGNQVKQSFGKLRRPERYWSRCCYKPIHFIRGPRK